MLGLTDKVLAMAGGAATIALAGTLALTVVSKNATIDNLEKHNRSLTTKVDALTSDLTQCRANRVTIEDAARRQSEAVAKARAESAGRIDRLQDAAQRANADAARAKREADRILASRGTGDTCADADALILEEVAP